MRVPMFEVLCIFDKGICMYKNPELSSMAKILVDEMAREGVTLKYTKALSIAAKMEGARNLHAYQAANKVRTEQNQLTDSATFFEGTVRDWNYQEAAEEGFVNPRQAREFHAKVEKNGSQFFIDISLPHKEPAEIDNTDQLSVFVEIHEGRPRVLLSNQLYGDQVLAVYGLAGGLVLEPMQNGDYLMSGVPNEPSQFEMFQEEQNRLGQRSTMNWMFMEAPNRFDD